MSSQTLPKTIKEQYVNFKKDHPLIAPSIRGFLMTNSARNGYHPAKTQDEWCCAIAHGYTKPEPDFGLMISGSVLLSAFPSSETLGITVGITVEQCLDMGFDPNVIYEKEGTNALHFAIYYGRWETVMRLVTEFGMSLVKNDGQGKPSFHYCRDGKFPDDFLFWLKTRSDLDEIIEANLNCDSPIKMEFQRLKAENISKKLISASEKEKQCKENEQRSLALKQIKELKEQVKLLETKFVYPKGVVATPAPMAVATLTATPIVATPVTTPIVATPNVNTPIVTTQIVATPIVAFSVATPIVATPAPKEKEKDDSLKLVSLKSTIITTRSFWGEEKQVLKWFDQLLCIIESKDDVDEIKIKKIRSSFNTVLMFTDNTKTKKWIQDNQI